MKLRQPDDLASTKSINSASDTWQRLLISAIRGALAKAVQKAIGPHEAKLGPSKTMSIFEGSFSPADGPLKEKTRQGRGSTDPLNAAAVFDAFAEHCCTGGSRSGDSFFFLYAPELAWRSSSGSCPMCTTEYDIFESKLGEQGFACQLCGFAMPLHHQSLEICKVTVVPRRQNLAELRRSQEARPSLQRLFFSLLVLRHLMQDDVGCSALNQALMGKTAERVGSVVAAGTENSAKGINTKRGARATVELHDNLIDCRSGKDNNPDLRVYLLNGSAVQWTPTKDAIAGLKNQFSIVQRTWDQSGRGRLEMRGETLWNFSEHSVAAVMQDI